ncbi:hypothetical protein OAG68_01755 [bacterium]|nr:hypothetical protein [bacterium]
MKVKFSMRALLVVMTIAAAYLGMIVWTQSKAKGFAEAMNRNSARVATKLLSDSNLSGRQDFCLGKPTGNRAEVMSPSVADMLLLRSYCFVSFQSCEAGSYYDNRVEYEIGFLGTTFKSSSQTASSTR